MSILKRGIKFISTQLDIVEILEKLREHRCFLIGVIITWC